jgi:hypothetical protein
LLKGKEKATVKSIAMADYGGQGPRIRAES